MSEKSKGVVLFAFNTDTVDYVKIATQSARLIKHHLNLPVTIITDQEVSNTFENHRTGYAGGTKWRNGDRYRAYELSPYDETILLDCDYLVFDDTLLKLLATTDDYKLIHKNTSPKQNMTGSMGITSIDFVWATVILFKRTNKSKLLFDLVGRIQRNYSYYRKLYNIHERNFRNDYAFAIANTIISGYTTNLSQSIPITMLTFDKPLTNIELYGSGLVVREAEQAYVIPRQNLHIMDKDYLLSSSYLNLVDAICQN